EGGRCREEYRSGVGAHEHRARKTEYHYDDQREEKDQVEADEASQPFKPPGRELTRSHLGPVMGSEIPPQDSGRGPCRAGPPSHRFRQRPSESQDTPALDELVDLPRTDRRHKP